MTPVEGMDETRRDPTRPRPADARVIRTRKDVLRTVLDLLAADGREAVTQPDIAQLAGYSRATVYKHWPTRVDLLREAFASLGDVEHPVPCGDLRADLVKELDVFRRAMKEQRLDCALATLADLTSSISDLRPVRDRLVADGEFVIRQLLSPVMRGDELEATTLMLCGAILHSALMHGKLPSRRVIAAAVDVALRGLEHGQGTRTAVRPSV